VNHAIFSTYYDQTGTTGRNHFITSNIDEAPAMMAMERLERLGCTVKMALANSQGSVDAQAIAETINPRTAMVSLSWANGLTGVINPVQEIAKVCQERAIVLHLDATHLLGKHFFELKEVGAALISFDGAHFHAPKGTGGLYVRSDTKLSPFIAGGLDQAGHRAGDLDIPGLVALGDAARQAIESRDYLCTEVARLRNRLEEGILKGYPEAVAFFKDQERLPHVSAIGFPGIANEALLFALNRKGVYASIGGGNFQQIGFILVAAGIAEPLANSTISFSLSRETQEGEIDQAVTIIVEAALQLRKLSTQLISKRGE
jgi:cysteine desulfurase